MVYRKCINPKVEDETIFHEVIDLHQKHFKLNGDDIITFLKNRDYVDLYYNKERRLVATVGIQWYEVGNNIVLYLGNAVVDDAYQKKGLMTRSLYRAVLTTIFKYPFKNKYTIALATSPKAYSYYSKMAHYWPKPYEPIPDEIKQLLETFLEENYQDHYQVNPDFFLVSPDTNKKISATHPIELRNRFDDLWFSLAIPKFEDGYQLPCVAKVDMTNFKIITKAALGLGKIKTIFSRRYFKVYEVMLRDYVYMGIILSVLFFLFRILLT